MSADFWAGYISGAAGILIGNPLDLIKVRLQASPSTLESTATTRPALTPSTYASQFTTASTLIRGAAAPILGYGALNALLFVTYNRTRSLFTDPFSQNLNSNLDSTPTTTPSLWTAFIAGSLGGLATWVISTPTELIKIRAQTTLTTSPIPNSTPTPNPASTWNITRSVLRTEGMRGLYFGGVVTALRDSVGYGFYFWSYEISTRYLAQHYPPATPGESSGQEAAKVLLCGGLAGVVTWTSIFPLDVIKTRVQSQVLASSTLPSSRGEASPLLGATPASSSTSSSTLDPELGVKRKGAIQIARQAYQTEGLGVFFRGLTICSVRAFMVNAIQWAVYEWIMRELDPERSSNGSGTEKQSTI